MTPSRKAKVDNLDHEIAESRRRCHGTISEILSLVDEVPQGVIDEVAADIEEALEKASCGKKTGTESGKKEGSKS